MDVKVVIRNIQDQKVEIFQNGISIGVCQNELQFNDIRVQVCRNQLDNVSFVYKGKEYKIKPNGDTTWENGLYDFEQRAFAEMTSYMFKDESKDFHSWYEEKVKELLHIEDINNLSKYVKEDVEKLLLNLYKQCIGGFVYPSQIPNDEKLKQNIERFLKTNRLN